MKMGSHKGPWCIVLLMTMACQSLASDAPKAIRGTFIQLNRAHAERTMAEWTADVLHMKIAGINTLIIQWAAENDISYFRSEALPHKEQYDVIEKIFAAVGSDMKVWLGLHQENHYWAQIQGRERVLRDYMNIRTAQNQLVQRALLSRFGEQSAWVGYYIPDEIDDLNWRTPGRRQHMQQYLSLMGTRIRMHDSRRRIGISAFFRVRSTPSVFAEALSDCVSESDVDCVMIQDGAGENDPPLEHLHLYLDALLDVQKQGRLPELWYVAEVFNRTSPPGASFAAEPASAARVEQQLRIAQSRFNGLVLFTFMDYVSPRLGEDASQLHKLLSIPPWSATTIK